MRPILASAEVDAPVIFVRSQHAAPADRLRDRRRLHRHRRRQGAARARLRLRLLRASDRVGGNWVFEQPQRDLLVVPLAAHQHVARADGVLRLPDAEVLSRTSRTTPTSPRTSTPTSTTSASATASASRRGVEHVARRADGGWEVTHDRTATRTYDALVVANGHHWDPRLPEPAFPGPRRFDGEQMHSHDYKGEDPALFRDRDVVVLGMGNSAMDIAVEASFVAAPHVPRRAPRRVGHPEVRVRPPARPRSACPPRIPFAVRRRVRRRCCGSIGRRHGALRAAASPTTRSARRTRRSPTTCSRASRTARSRRSRTSPRSTAHASASPTAPRSHADVVVYCTGYKVTFPFFDPG